jgi:peroxiredoxin
MSRLSSSTLRVGDSSPPVVLPTRDGELVDLSALLDLGSVLIVFVPGTWSPNTRHLLEALERAHEGFRAVGVVPVVVATQDQGRLTKALTYSTPSFLILSDETRDAARDYGVYRAFSWDGIGVTCPSVFLVGRDARLRFIYVGERDADVPDIDTVLQLATWLVGGAPVVDIAEPAVAAAPLLDEVTVEFPAVAIAEEQIEEPLEVQEALDESEAVDGDLTPGEPEPVRETYPDGTDIAETAEAPVAADGDDARLSETEASGELAQPTEHDQHPPTNNDASGEVPHENPEPAVRVASAASTSDSRPA